MNKNDHMELVITLELEYITTINKLSSSIILNAVIYFFGWVFRIKRVPT